MSKLLYPPITTPCIISPYQPNSDGYISLWVKTAKGKDVRVGQHRLVYAQAHNMTPADMKNLIVMHKCDVRNCINPEHLMLGTAEDNMRDMVNKGRHVTHFVAGNQFEKLGTGNARLTPDQVRAIRAERDRGQSRYWPALPESVAWPA